MSLCTLWHRPSLTNLPLPAGCGAHSAQCLLGCSNPIAPSSVITTFLHLTWKLKLGTGLWRIGWARGLCWHCPGWAGVLSPFWAPTHSLCSICHNYPTISFKCTATIATDRCSVPALVQASESQAQILTPSSLGLPGQGGTVKPEIQRLPTRCPHVFKPL